MKILIVEGEASNRLGGAELSMFSYIKHLDSIGHEVFLTYENRGDWLDSNNSSLFKDVKCIQIKSFTASNLLSFSKNLKRFIYFTKTNKIDVIFTHTIHGFLFLRIANLFLALDIVVYFKWVYNSPSIGVLNKWGIKGVSRAAFLPAVKNYWLDNGLHPKTKKVSFYDGLKIEDEFLENLHPINKISNLTYFGRINKDKGVHLIIEAIAGFKNLKLDIYGKLDDEDYILKLRSQIKRLKLENKVSFMNFTSNPVKRIVGYDMVIVPSIAYEAQGRVLFEAMYTKTIVIASNNGGMPDILGDYKDKLIFEPNVLSLSCKLNEILNLDAKEIVQMKNYLNTRFLENYSEEITHSKLNQFLFEKDSILS